MPTLDELEWRTLQQGDRAQWHKNDSEYIEVWRWRNDNRYYDVYFFNVSKNEREMHYGMRGSEADRLVCDYSDGDHLTAYCRRLVESGEAEPLPYGLDKLLRRKR